MYIHISVSVAILAICINIKLNTNPNQYIPLKSSTIWIILAFSLCISIITSYFTSSSHNPYIHLHVCSVLVYMYNCCFSLQFSNNKCFPGGSMVKYLPSMPETWVRSLDRKDPLEKEMATHSRILDLIPLTEEPGGLQSMGSQRVRHDWVISLYTTTNDIVP